jgi:hypothetical protein
MGLSKARARDNVIVFLSDGAGVSKKKTSLLACAVCSA